MYRALKRRLELGRVFPRTFTDERWRRKRATRRSRSPGPVATWQDVSFTALFSFVVDAQAGFLDSGLSRR